MERIVNGTPASHIAGATWRKSSRSGAQGNCVEVTPLGGGRIAVRNSRFPGGPALVYSREEMSAFVAAAKAGEFDDIG